MCKTFYANADARGIGLFITKNQVEAMEGKITVESIVELYERLLALSGEQQQAKSMKGE